MVELKNVSVTYSNGVDALHDVSLRINDGEFAFVVGKSGAGKSTLIKLLLKEISPNSGKITVNGFNLEKLKKSKAHKLRRTIGFVFQDFKLINTMNVYDNVAFVLRSIDAPLKYIRNRVPYVISLVGLKDKAKCFPNELSGGEQQRVSIARALAKMPKLLLCDEPTGALDYRTGKTILKLLQDTCRNTGTTVVVITHNLAITPMADRVITIKSSKVESVELNENPMSIDDIEW